MITKAISEVASPPKRVAIIGLGKVAVPHLNAYRTLEGIEVVGGVDLNADRAQAIAKEYGFPAYDNIDTLVAREKPDIAVILTPAASHRSVSSTLVEHAVHVLCEKPLAATLSDGLQMLDDCERHTISFCYGSSYRYLPALVEARRIVQSGSIGTPVLLRESVIGGSGTSGRRAMDSQHYPVGAPGGTGMGLVDHGIHLIDVFSWLLDSHPVGVWGSGNRSGFPPESEFLVLRFACGAVGHLLYNDHTFSTGMPFEAMFGLCKWAPGFAGGQGSWQEHPGFIDIYGDDGSIRVYHYANRLFCFDRSGIREVPISLEWASPRHFALQLQSFIAYLEGEDISIASVKDGLAAMRVLHTVYADEPQWNGKWMDVA